jgi:hypothetical protein
MIGEKEAHSLNTLLDPEVNRRQCGSNMETQQRHSTVRTRTSTRFRRMDDTSAKYLIIYKIVSTANESHVALPIRSQC